MKPGLLFFLLFSSLASTAQSLDYISVRKPNGQVVKNFYTGSDVLFQLADGSYLKGPIENVRNDSVYVRVYDIRYYPTAWGTYMKDTVATTDIGIRYKEISRVFLNRRKTFFQRTAGPLLMLGGGTYLAVNLLNGAFYDLPLTDSKNLRRLGIAAGSFGLGYLFKKLFASDGFSSRKLHIVYVDL